MAYARLSTKNNAGLHPDMRGMGAYGHNSTKNNNGLWPGFRGMGDAPLTNISIGPGGQFAISTATVPTQTSVWDGIMTWMGESSIIGGMPNSVFAIGGAFLVLAKVFGGRRR